MQTSLRALSLLACVCAGVSTARAQYPQRRDGFWIGFGLGYGTARVTCDSCQRVSQNGVTAFLKLGGTPSRHVRIGAALNGWSHSDGSATETLANVTASLYLYPAARSGLFVTGGLGFSGYHVNSYPSWDGTGWGYTVGAGYDFRVGRDVALTPVVNYTWGSVGDVNQAGGGAYFTGWKQEVLDFGLGVTFH
ncbi:MAG TPA: outer membrane beta-barrel protein [Gemmatimonadales bacterium]|nr:outer membrane beta-barrel protein [Gemmatimonadales bacterium]